MKNIRCLDFLSKRGLTPKRMNGDILSRMGSGGMDFMKELDIRESFRRKYGFAIINEGAIEVIRKYNPILEIGAGTGYWAYELQRRGVDIIATDLRGPKWFKDWGWDNHQKEWISVKEWEASDAVKKYKNRNLLIVWPSLNGDWVASALEVFKGEIVIYVGEAKGGCTGNDRFHELLETQFNEIETLDIPRFTGMYDRLMVYQRKTGK